MNLRSGGGLLAEAELEAVLLEAEGAVDGFGDATLVGDDDELIDLGEGLTNDGVEEGGADPFSTVGHRGADVLEAGDFSSEVEVESHVADEFVSEEGSPPVAVAAFRIEAVVGHLVGFEDAVVGCTDAGEAFGDLEFDRGLPFPIVGEFPDVEVGIGADLSGGVGEGEDGFFVEFEAVFHEL